ncbi:MAG: PD-(D/E)XK nuclease family protein [Candidatus Heimdallarchaeota archaeon]
MDYELNLSATEFLYFLECPQKFRIYRMLNPIPTKDGFVNSRSRSLTSYKMRGYDKNKEKGLAYHKYFETFHKEYSLEIMNKTPPEEVTEDDVKLLFWIIEQEKYLKASDHNEWFPQATEIKLMTNRQRGKIDRIEFSKDNSGLKLIDYKPVPEPNDHLLMLFYANLLKNYRIENKEVDKFVYDAVEIGCYYYSMGIERAFELTDEYMSNFVFTYTECLNKIANIEFFRNKRFCWNCQYKIICKIEIARSK